MMHMRQLRGWLVRLFGLFQRARREREFAEELESHLAMHIEDNLRAGLSPEEARRRALIKLGGVTLTKERSREQGGLPMLETLGQDLRFGLRMLRKNPGFSLIAILTLALGIGANTAIFSVFNAVLLRPLPFKESERVVMVWQINTAAAGGNRTPFTVDTLLDLRKQSKSFDEFAAFLISTRNFTGRETPEQVRTALVTANFFTALGAEPQLGRTFLPEEEHLGAEMVVVLSDGFWRSRFAADPQVVGRAINFNGRSFTVVGVMPPALNFPEKEVELWSPLPLEHPVVRGQSPLHGVARLQPGVTVAQALAETRTLKSSFDKNAYNLNLLPVNDFVVGDVRPALLALLVAVMLLLLIAAVNVANLMLVRAAARVKEISIRTALGAGRGRIIRQLLTESLLLVLMGGVLGTLGAMVGIDLLVKLAPQGIPRLEHVGIDARVLGWTALVSLLTGVACGLTPAWQSARLKLNDALKEGGRGTTEGAGQRRWRSSLVVVELALAVMLLIGAGLLLKSLWRLQQVDPGVKEERVLTMFLTLVGQRYSQDQQLVDFYARLLESVQALSGVRAAALSNSLPPGSYEYSTIFHIEGRPSTPDHPPFVAYVIRTSPSYPRTFGIALRSGRQFTASDNADAPRVLLINETFQRRFFPNEDPVGKRIHVGGGEQRDWREIVGVIGDVKYNGLADEVQPAVYQPLAQSQTRAIFLSLKTDTADPLGLTPAVRNAIKSVDSEVPIARISTMEQRLAAARAQLRFRATLIALFAALALILACIGIYGVISYSVAQRTHEIGVRLALGAQSRDVLRLVVGQGLKLTLAGVGCGLMASLALARFMQQLLFQVKPTDPLAFAGTAILLAGVALLACYVPARRATKVDPLQALRHE
jgi:putative ABC transport system permease protein